MDFTLEFARAWLTLAEIVGGNAEVAPGNILIIRLDTPDAPRLSNVLTEEDWPYSYVIAYDDYTLIADIY